MGAERGKSALGEPASRGPARIDGKDGAALQPLCGSVRKQPQRIQTEVSAHSSQPEERADPFPAPQPQRGVFMLRLCECGYSEN